MIKFGQGMVGLPLIAATAFFMQLLDATILNTALPAIASSLKRSPLEMQSAVISYTLTVALLIPVSGWLADKFGTCRVFIFAVSLFALGSLACALSDSLIMLVISRVIQGIGGAMMMPVARLALLRAYPPNELLAVFNFVTIPGLIGPVIGPMLGGMLVTWASWHWIFLINIPISLMGIVYARRHMPNFTLPVMRFDFTGFILFGLSLVLISCGLDLFSERMISPLTAMVVLLVGVLLLLKYIGHARRHPSPIINLAIFKIRTFYVGIIGSIATRLGTGAVPFLLPLMLQVGFNYPAIVAGFIMAPTAIGSIVAKLIAIPLLRQWGYRKALVNVSVIIGLLIACFALQSPGYSIFWILATMFVLGMAMSTQFTAMNSITIADLSGSDTSSGNSVLAVTQQLAISFGAAVGAAVLNFFQTTGHSTVKNFHLTCVTMGIITVLGAMVFLLLKEGDGDLLIGDKKVKEN